MAIWTLARKDLRVLLRDTRAAIILLTMPLFFILVLGLALGGDERLRVSIVDEDAGIPLKPGEFPGRRWSEVVRQDLSETGGIQVDVIPSREEAQKLVNTGRRSAVLVFTPGFSEKVHHSSFLDDRFLNNEPGYNPFYREGVDLKVLGIDVLEDPKQALGASVIRQVAQVSTMRVVMPWMIGKAFDKISDKQLIDEMARRIEVTPSLMVPVKKPLALLNDSQKMEAGKGVQSSIQLMFSKYNLQAKTWESLTKAKAGAAPSNHSGAGAPDGGFLNRGAIRYQLLVPSYTVMFAFFLVLTAGWLFVSERRQGTLLRLRASPITRAEILMGKVIPCYFVSVIQGVFLLGAGWLIFGMNWGPRPAMLLPVVATTSLAAVGLSMLVASVARTESQVSIYGSLLVLILGGVSGCLMPWDQMPENMRTISRLTPHAWALGAYQELLLPNPHLATVWLACAVLAAFGVVFIALAWLVLRLD